MQYELVIKLKDYETTVVIPVIDRTETDLVDLNISDYIDTTAKRILAKLDEARVSLITVQKETKANNQVNN